MDDIEEWLCADVKGEEAEEGVTSEDFDKFLEERAKVADQGPPLAAAAATGEPRPLVSASSSNRRRTQQTEDNLFAL